LSQDFFRRFPTSDGTCWELPRRELGEIAKFGWLLVAICAIGSLFLLVWSAVWLLVGISFVVDGHIWGLGVAAISLIGLAGLLYLLRFGMLGWYLVRSKTSCRVKVGPKFLFSNEPLGLFTWRRKCETAKIKQLMIERSRTGRRSSEQLNLDIDADLMTIRAVTDGNPFLVAPGYRYEVLSPLISEIGAELNRRRGADTPIVISMEVSEPVAGLVENDALVQQGLQTNKMGDAAFLEQPANSKIEIHDRGGNKAYQVPPVGIRKGSKGLLGFSIAWNLFILVFTVVMIVIFLVDDLPEGFGWLGFSLFASVAAVFWLVGILSLVSAINAGRRSAMLGIADGQLFVERKSIFGTKWLELPIDKVKKIGVGPSGTEINNVPVLELQIRDTDSHNHGLLSQLANDDLYWLAQELRQSLESANH
jgi:hypothetical protein